MKLYLKNIGIFVLFIAVTAPIFITFLSYNLQVKKIKKQVKHHLIQNTPKDKLVAFEFDMKSKKFLSLKWKHSREFEYNSKMFDIVEADTLGNTVKYICFPDKQETALNQQLKDLLNARYANDEPTKNNARLITSFIRSLFPIDYSSMLCFNRKFSKHKFIFQNGYYQSILLEVNSPPPII